MFNVVPGYQNVEPERGTGGRAGIHTAVIPTKVGIQYFQYITGLPFRLCLLSRSISCIHAVVHGSDEESSFLRTTPWIYALRVYR